MLLSIAQPTPNQEHPSMVTLTSDLIEWSRFMLRYHEQFSDIKLIVTGDITLRLRIPSDPLKHALLNLILNAAQAQAGSGQLWIDLQIQDSPHTVHTHISSPRGVKLTLCDQGPGLDQTQLEHHLTSSTQHLNQRRGMGLSIAQESIEQHGGHLWLVSAWASQQSKAIPHQAASSKRCLEVNGSMIRKKQH